MNLINIAESFGIELMHLMRTCSTSSYYKYKTVIQYLVSQSIPFITAATIWDHDNFLSTSQMQFKISPLKGSPRQTDIHVS